MSADQATFWRTWVGKAAGLFCMLFLIAALDAVQATFRQPDNLLHLLPGDSEKINGSLREATPIQDLTYAAGSDLIRLAFDAMNPGFWLGGVMWRGTLTLDPGIAPGDYTLQVVRKGEPPEKASTIFNLKIFPDYAAYRWASKSLIRRFLDLSPWWVFGTCFSLTCAAFGAVFLLSQKRDAALAREGKAEVYHINKSEAGLEIAFGLGKKHGVQPDTRFTLGDADGSPVASFKARLVTESDSTALLPQDCTIKPGYLVSVERW